MALKSLLFSCLLALICTSHILAAPPKSFKFTTPRNLGGYYTQPGTFPLVQAEASIVQQQPGVYINVYFDKMTDGGSGSLDFNVKGGTLMLSLYSSKTLLSLDCQGFNKYNCSNYNCTELPEQIDSISFPDFKGDGHYATANVFIDPNYWVLKTQPLLLTDCSSFKNDKFGTGTTGILGLGVTGDALGNFITNQTFESIMGGSESVNRLTAPLFSFFLTADGKSGELIFDVDLTKTMTSTPALTLSTDTDWHVAGVASVQVGSNDPIALTDTTLIFDINSEALGLPNDVYVRVINMINSSGVSGLVCPTGVSYRPTCSYVGSLDALPQLEIVVGGQTINIPPTVYAEVVEKIEGKPDHIIVNLRGLSPGGKDRSYATPEWSNFVILDQHVMGYYYTVFDTTKVADSDNLQIKMYLANHGSSDKALITILICVVIGLIVGLSIYRYKKIKKARMAANPPLLQAQMGHELNVMGRR